MVPARSESVTSPGRDGAPANRTNGMEPPEHGGAFIPTDIDEAPPTMSLLDSGARAEPWSAAQEASFGLRRRRAGDDLLARSAEDWARWVMVYGMPAGCVAEVVDHFRVYGQVVENRVGQGNWVLLRYATVLQARKALASGNHARISGGRIMVGTSAIDAAAAAQLVVDDDATERLARRCASPPPAHVPLGGGARLRPPRQRSPALPSAIGYAPPVRPRATVRRVAAIDDSDLLQEAPRARKWNVCDRIYQYIFSGTRAVHD
ncbi:hypothetical protein JKP88DRAFT_286064 [Tribonema minus]|uniref:RRM Nup35-type domain-containing protein n=1 Tax=Tribonema minus TaxID=303371 RepID=A0A836CNV8_9STRA|nr:hypothetical protein JKP88DRAFT_286064 [Tribonema minus]